LPETNKYYLEIIRKNVTENITTESEGILITQILMSCPMATILDYPYSIVEGIPKIEFPKNL
jgi:hypothetical protein